MSAQGTFMQRLAAQVLEVHGECPEDLVMVFPNRRSGLFFRKAMVGALGGRASILPQVFSGDEFMAWVSGLDVIDDISLLFEFHTVYEDIEADKAQKFDEIMGWAEVLLDDFNETDLWLADPREVFTYITEAKAISLWNPGADGLTELQSEYLGFYDRILDYYEALKASLLSHGMAYSGLAYRRAAEVLAEGPWPSGLEGRKVIIAGFNALTRAEEKVFGELHMAGKASFLWDADAYYLDDEQQEAGHFLRQYRADPRRFGPIEAGSGIATRARVIRIQGFSSTMAQAAYCASTVAGLDEEELGSTAIVVNDERMVMPLLNALPSHIRKVNLTMQLPLRHTPAASFTELAFNVLLTRRGGREGRLLHTSSLRDLLRHPWLKVTRRPGTAGEDPPGPFATITQALRYLGLDDGELNDALRSFAEAEDPYFALLSLQRLCYAIRDKRGQEEQDGFSGLALGELLDLLGSLRERPLAGRIGNLRTLRLIMVRLMNRHGLRFTGEPLEGLQVMGMLETRALDFERVIMTGMNEGKVPRQPSKPTFLPLDLRKHFGLPLPHHHDAIYAYHFYRLLQGSSEAHLLYSVQTEKVGSSEMSRFLRQLLWEYPRKRLGADIRHVLPVSPPAFAMEVTPSAPRSADTEPMLIEWAQSRISASSLNTWLRCQLKFYYKYLAKLPDTSESPTLGITERGTIVHRVLEDIYRSSDRPDFGNVLRETSKRATRLVEEEMARQVHPDVFSSGPDYLWKEVAGRMLRNFLLQEAGHFEQEGFRIIDLESELSRDMEAGGLDCRFYGVVDRLDESGGLLRIIDYKTGNTKQEDVTFKEVDFLHDGKKEKGFQLMFYAWLLDGQGNASPKVAGIHSLRAHSQGLILLNVAGQQVISRELSDEFGRQLRSIISDITQGGDDFIGTDDEQSCRYCNYRGLCGR